MNCKECHDLVERYIDGALRGSIRRKVSLHLSRCTACREYFDVRRQDHAKAYRAMNAALGGERLPPGFAQRFRAAHVVPERRLWPFGRSRWKAAAMLAMLLGGMVVAATVAVVELRGTTAPGGANESERGAAPAGRDVLDAPDSAERDVLDAPDSAERAVPGAQSIPEAISHDSSTIHSEETPMNNQTTASTVARSAAKAMATAVLALGTPATTQASAVTTNLVDAVEIVADTNIVVAANEVLKIEYVYGDNPVTVTKSGGGRLEIATSSITNLSVVIAEGAFASARPAALTLDESFMPALRIDANRPDTITIAESNGTNFVSKVTDADGNAVRWLTNWGSSYHKAFVAEEKLNGMSLFDFGTYYDRDIPRFAEGHGGNFAANKVDGTDGFTLKEYFYVWKDRDDMFDGPLLDGKEFRGPSVLGNNGTAYLRGNGGAGTGFELVSDGMYNTFKNNIYLDGVKVSRSFRPSRGFHVLRNRVYDDREISLTMIGCNGYRRGGFLLAELIACSNTLSEATAQRVEAQLQSKWLGMKLNALTLNEGAELDVSAFKFSIGTMDISGTATVTGETNLCFKSLVRTASAVAAAGTFAVNGGNSPLLPDLAFDGDAMFDVAGTSRVQTVSATSDRFVKTGAGELRLVDPVMSNITVLAGTLSVSPLYVRSAEYHLDANAADTISWTESDGKKLVSQWRDMEDASRLFKPTSYRKYSWNSSLFVRGPYVTANAAGDKPMVDFGTFANANHQEGWGGCLEPSSSLSGLHDVFAVWQDHPEVKDYTYGSDYGTDFYGPCIFGLQYYWFRGTGGNGNSFAMHHGTAPDSMHKDDGLVWIDGVEVDGRNFRTGDGIHVYSQRISGSGAPIEQMGGAMQAGVKTTSESTSVQGTYGGLMIGEVLMFKEYLTDRLRMRISGALNAKWRGATNEWAYGEVSVAAGATLNHPYADLAVENLHLSGTLAATRVMPATLTLSGSDAALDGMLELGEGGQVVVCVSPDGSFGSVRASGVRVAGDGTVAFRGTISNALCGKSLRIVEAGNVEAPGMSWKAPSLRGTGLRAVLSGREDGLYLTFSSSGFVISFK